MSDEIHQLISQLEEKIKEYNATVDPRPLIESPRAYTNQLTPPIGTSFCKRQTITIFDQEPVWHVLDGGDWQISTLMEILTWRVDVYTYVTGVRPDDPQFTDKGGSVLILMVHSGVGDPRYIAENTTYSQKIKVPSSVIPYRQYPASNSGTQNGDDWNYTISYKETLQLFNNAGNAVTSFDAVYSEDFTRTASKQIGQEAVDNLEFGATYQKSLPNGTTLPIIGFSAFKCTDIAAFPVTFNFQALAIWPAGSPIDAGSSSINKDVTFDLNFLG